MPKESKEKLERFMQGGGCVYVVKGESVPNIQGAICVENCKGLLCASVDFAKAETDIRVYNRVLENGKLTLLFNQAFQQKEVEIKVGEERVYLIDITAGKIRTLESVGAIAKIPMQSGETVALFYANECLETTDICTEKEMELNGEYTFCRTKRFIFGEKTYACENIVEKEQKVALGDWSKYADKDFSGSGVYKTLFARPNGLKEKLVLDLGEVKYTCEVFLNGTSLGVKTLSPYRYEIPVALIQEENELKIRVSNTIANELLSTKTFDKWETWQLSPYLEKARHFAKDYLEGGLFGPVKLKY
jgi:hypothetical protein